MNNDRFEYNYKAPTEEERKEIASIRRRYAMHPKAEETKLDRLRRLDGLVKNAATYISLVLGIVGCLTFGLGLTMILEWNRMVFGVIVCVIGGIPMTLAYPVYRFVFRKQKEKYGEEILKLSEELLADKDLQNFNV